MEDDQYSSDRYGTWQDARAYSATQKMCTPDAASVERDPHKASRSLLEIPSLPAPAFQADSARSRKLCRTHEHVAMDPSRHVELCLVGFPAMAPSVLRIVALFETLQQLYDQKLICLLVQNCQRWRAPQVLLAVQKKGQVHPEPDQPLLKQPLKVRTLQIHVCCSDTQLMKQEQSLNEACLEPLLSVLQAVHLCRCLTRGILCKHTVLSSRLLSKHP